MEPSAEEFIEVGFMRRIILFFLFIITPGLQGQWAPQQRLLIDLPTAGTLDRGSYEIRLRMFDNGGLIGSVGVGISDRFMFGLSYGGENIIGAGDINWNPDPGIQARFRVIDEDFSLPAVTIGFDSQGFGPFLKQQKVDSSGKTQKIERFTNKSRGFFAVATKNYALFHNLGFHGGVNVSLEDEDNDQDLNFFIGADLSFNREFKVLAEYDFAWNDNENDKEFGSGDGYLNLGGQWTFSDRLVLQFHLKNVFENGPGKITREFKVGYFEYF